MTSYEDSIKNHRAQRDEKTAANPLYWLNLAGLFWLEKGGNSFGSAEGSNICLPAFPNSHCGSLHLENGIVTLHPVEGIKITVNGKAPKDGPLHTDREKDPDLISIGSLTMKIIIRGGEPLIRIWDR